jgi:hypothetical protein
MTRLKATFLVSRRLLAVASLCALAHAATPEAAFAHPQFVTRPYLMDVTTNSIAVLFVLAHEQPVVVTAVSPAHTAKRYERPASRVHEVVMDGLDVDTQYAYRVFVANDEIARGTFTTAPAAPDAPVNFLIYGDTRTNPAAHASVIRAMSDEAADFVLHTGDFIADGRRAESWATFFDVAAPLFASTPLIPTIGNHDLYAGAGLRNYRAHMRVAAGGSEHETYFVFRYGATVMISLDTEESLAPGEPQRVWLERALRSLRDDHAVKHIFAMMHHGPFSSGAHGGNPAIAGTDIEGLLRRGGVELVLSGHDHTYERGDASGLKYIVSGGGGAPLYFSNSEQPTQLAFSPVHHFVRVEIRGDEVRIAAIRTDGHTFDRCYFRGTRDPWHCTGGSSRGNVVRAASSSMSRYVIALGVVLVVAVAILARRGRNAKKKAS